MKIIVSACLLGENCKYSGGSNRSEAVISFVRGHDVIPVCPEVLGGLDTPRVPSEILNGQVINKNGESVDAQFRAGALAAFEKAGRGGADLAILKSRSPSCGKSRIYDGSFSATLTDGNGVFAQMLIDAGIRVVSEEELNLLSHE